jgi:hypothetical protein
MATEEISSGMQNALDGKLPPKIPVFGKYIYLRRTQMILWSVVVGAVFAAIVAGGYYALLQTNWHAFDLKNWWDSGMGFIHSKSWVLYRHGLRDLGEPAAATMGVMTLLAKPKWWTVRVGAVRLATTPVVLVVLAVALIVGGIWLVDFGLPAAWHGLFGNYHLTGWFTNALGKASFTTLLLGFLIGRVLHRVWAPVGATLQGYAVDRPVDKAKLSDRIPLWVKYPDVPPVIRERFSWTWDHDADVKARRPSRATKILMGVLIVLGVLLAFTGFVAHYWIGKGNSFPFLAP